MELAVDEVAQLSAQVLAGSLDWISTNLAFFDPFKAGHLRDLCEIPLAELAILTLTSLRCSARRERPELSGFLGMLEASYCRSEFRERPFREPECLVSHLMVGAALARSGRLQPSEFVPGTQLLLKHSTVTTPSMAPHRALELRHVLDLAGVPHDLPSYQRLYRATTAARVVNPVFVSKAEAYILTHVVFYASDLGQVPARGLDPVERRRLGRLAEQLLGMHIVGRNWDLTAEFIVMAVALRRPCSFLGVAWEALAAAQRSDGAVPGIRAAAKATTTDSAVQTDDIEDVYHTTLVCALAALVTLQHVRTVRAA